MTAHLDGLLTEASAALSVVADMGAAANKEDAERIAQLLLAHAAAIVELSKRVAIPHKLALEFHGCTLRYPEDCAQADALQEDLEALGTTYPSYASYLEETRKHIQPKFLPDKIWDSSENCSDQGLGIFRYDDFVHDRGW